MTRSLPTRALVFLFLSTVITGSVLFYLVSQERHRSALRNLESARFKGRALADRVAAMVIDVESDLTLALEIIDIQRLETTLLREHQSNPLIRNIFIWQPALGVVLPSPSAPANREEQRFLDRYARLFRNPMTWQGSSTAPEQQESSQSFGLKNYTRFGSQPSQATPIQAWQTWFWEDRLYMLGWHQDPQSGMVWGLELESAALWAQILPQLSGDDLGDVSLVIQDSQGRMVHWLGQTMPTTGSKADLLIPVGAVLPHWQVAVYLPANTGASNHTGYWLMLYLLLILLLAAIVLSGWSLMAQARRHFSEARQKTNFVGNVSHELKTPLTTIRMYAELLQQGRVDDDCKKKKYLNIIVAESQRLSRLVHNVLEFSRLERGNRKVHPRVGHLIHFLETWLQTQAPRIEAAGFTLETHFPAEDIQWSFDPDALEQILLNLLDNALKYGKESAASANDQPSGQLLLEVYRQQDTMFIDICDRGPGISAAHRNQIFDSFYRVDNQLERTQGGSGIGLSLARQLARVMAGDLVYKPRKQGGSRFSIRLPLTEPERSIKGNQP